MNHLVLCDFDSFEKLRKFKINLKKLTLIRCNEEIWKFGIKNIEERLEFRKCTINSPITIPSIKELVFKETRCLKRFECSGEIGYLEIINSKINGLKELNVKKLKYHKNLLSSKEINDLKSMRKKVKLIKVGNFGNKCDSLHFNRSNSDGGHRRAGDCPRGQDLDSRGHEHGSKVE